METTCGILYEEEYYQDHFDDHPSIRVRLLEFAEPIHLYSYRILETMCDKRDPISLSELLDDMTESAAIRFAISSFDNLKVVYYTPIE